MEFLHGKKKITFISLILLGLFAINTGSYALGAAGDIWPKNPNPPQAWGWISPEGYKYYMRYRINIPSVDGGTYYNEPIKITPWFPDRNATKDSLRIVYYNDTTGDYVEIPYVLDSYESYNVNYISSAVIYFVAPVLYGRYYLLYSNDTSFNAPSYSREDYLPVENNYMTQAYYNGQLGDSFELRFDSPGNKTIELLVPRSSNVDDVNITGAHFDYSIKPIFNEYNTIPLLNRYDGMGPASLRFFNGTVYGNYTNPYLLIGGPQYGYVFQYQNSSGIFHSVNNVSVGTLVGGIDLGNVLGTYDSDVEIIFGERDGDIHIYSYDGSFSGAITEQKVVFINNSPSVKFQKPFGVAVVNFYNDTLAGNPANDMTDLVAIANGPESNNFIQAYWYNSSNGELLKLDPHTSQNQPFLGHYGDSSNYSFEIISYIYHNPKDRYNFFEANYQHGGDNIDEDEFMTWYPDQYGRLAVGIYDGHYTIDPITKDHYIKYYSRLRTGSSDVDDILLDQFKGAAGLEVSEKISPYANNPFVIGAGMDNQGNIIFTWKNFSKTLDGSYSGYYAEGDEHYGYLSFDKSYSYTINKNDLPYSATDTVLTCTKGEFDGLNLGYDDILFVDNHGYYYLFAYDPSVNNIAFKTMGSLLGEEKNLFGTGQSIDAFDYNYDGIDEIAIGDGDGLVHFVDLSFGQNFTAWTRIGMGTHDYNKSYELIRTFDYDDINTDRTINDISTEMNIFLGNTTRDGAGLGGPYDDYDYWNVSINIQVDAPCIVNLSNFFVNYTTNNYRLVEHNRKTSPSFHPDLDNAPIEYLDYDNDGLYDIFEAQNILVWNPEFAAWGNTIPTTTTGVVCFNSYINETWAYNQTLKYVHCDPSNNDTDGDGIADGLEIMLYGTNPSHEDTDRDEVTDYDELFKYVALYGYHMNPLKNDTDGDRLYDNLELIHGSNPNDKNTDHDTVEITTETGDKIEYEYDDYQEVIHNTDPTKLDTDGDGLLDTEEMGIISDPSTMMVYYNSLKDSHGVIGTEVLFANTTEYINQFFPDSLVYLTNPNAPGLVLNPLNPDSDGDGLSDYEEIRIPYEYNGQNYFSHPGMSDTDGDNLTDFEEYNYTFNYITYNSKGERVKAVDWARLNPDNSDTDADGIADGIELLYLTSPVNNDTDSDSLLDGDEVAGFNFTKYYNLDSDTPLVVQTDPTNRDTDGDGLYDGWECYGFTVTSNGTIVPYWYFGMGKNTVLFSNPALNDSDGDGISDYEEIFGRVVDGVNMGPTNPINPDTDGDGISDLEDPMPVLNQNLHGFLMSLYLTAAVGAASMAIVNKYSAEKILARRMKFEATLDKAARIMEQDRIEEGAFKVKVSSIPTSDPENFKVKITMQIIDDSFFGQKCRINYSAGAEPFKKVEARKITDDEYEFVLDKIPVDTRVLYSVEFLDKGGEWVVDDNHGKFYTFATNKDGSIDTHHDDDWVVDRGVKCPVCGYLCLPEWDECPNCGTPLHEDESLALIEDEKKKMELLKQREMDKEAIAWAEAQKTDEVWRGLPNCPECGIAVQPEWAKCPVCGADLTQYHLKRRAAYEIEEIDMDYIEGKDEEEIPQEYELDVEEIKSEKEILDELDEEERKKKEDAWNVDTDEDIDIL